MDATDLKNEICRMKQNLNTFCKPCYWNPVSNPYTVNPRTGLDHFSNLAWQMTMWKMENVFSYDLRLRVPAVALLTIFSMKMSRGTSKLLFGGLTYYISASALAPEIINPYYLNRKFILIQNDAGVSQKSE